VSYPVNAPTTEEQLEALEAAGLRAELGDRLGVRISDAAWVAIVAAEPPTLPLDSPDLWLTDAEGPARRLAEALASARIERSKRTTVQRGPSELPTEEDHRWSALAEIFALEASRAPDVTAWREANLPDGLLPGDEVESFVTSLSENDQREASATSGLIDYELLTYSTPSGVRYVLGLSRGGVLHGLLDIARRLGDAYHWQPAEATAFVLTGNPPSCLPIGFRIDVDEGRAGSSRIVLDADPRVPAKAIAEAFEQARRHEALAGVDVGVRYRPVREPLARLAVFLAHHPAGTWRERREQWNTECPKAWRYATEREFSRDAYRAWQAVVGGQLPIDTTAPAERVTISEAERVPVTEVERVGPSGGAERVTASTARWAGASTPKPQGKKPRRPKGGASA
jgi:hypothetical protein